MSNLRNETATPWSWQQPPLPRHLSVLSSKETRHSAIWYRRFWGVESLSAADIVSTPGQADLILSCHVSIPQGNNYRKLDIRAVKCAVRALRFGHPSIASQYAWPDPITLDSKPLRPGDGRMAYQVPNGESDVEEWLSRVVINQESTLQACDLDLLQAVDSVRRDLGRAFPEPRMNTFQLHFIPSSGAAQPHAIVLFMGHAVFDATAAFQVMNLLLSNIAQIVDIKSDIAKGFTWGEEVKRLAKPFPDRGIIPWSSEKIDEDLCMIKRVQDSRRFLKTAHGLSIANPTAMPSTTGWIFRKVSSIGLSRLMKNLRRHKCTMFCVLQATSTITTLRINPPKAGLNDLTTPISGSPFNLRTKYLSENENEKDQWQIISALAMTVLFAQDLGRFIHDDFSDKRRLIDDVFTLAGELGRQLAEQRLLMPRASFWVDEFIDAVLSGGTESGSESLCPNVTIPFITSFGVMDTNLSAIYPIPTRSDAKDTVQISNPLFSVRNPYSALGLTLHAYTWQEVLHLSFSYPEAYMGTQKWEVSGGREDPPGERKANILDFVQEFMSILDTVIQDTDDNFDDSCY